MKKLIELFDGFEWDTAIMVFLIIASVLLAVLGIILSLVYSPCDFCRYLKKYASDEPCSSCKHVLRGEESRFEWRGVKED